MVLNATWKCVRGLRLGLLPVMTWSIQLKSEQDKAKIWSDQLHTLFGWIYRYTIVDIVIIFMTINLTHLKANCDRWENSSWSIEVTYRVNVPDLEMSLVLPLVVCVCSFTNITSPCAWGNTVALTVEWMRDNPVGPLTSTSL